MEYVGLSLEEEMEQLEREVTQELNSMERVITKNIIGE